MTRALHLDVVPDQSTQSFLRCLKRFAARRDLPAKFLSDNGKTLAAAKYIKNVMKDGTVTKYLTGLGTEWTFNVECAPWWGSRMSGGSFDRRMGESIAPYDVASTPRDFKPRTRHARAV